MIKKGFFIRILIVIGVVLTLAFCLFASDASAQDKKKEDGKKKVKKTRVYIKKGSPKGESYAEMKKRLEKEKLLRTKRLQQRRSKKTARPKYYPTGKKPDYKRVVVPPPGTPYNASRVLNRANASSRTRGSEIKKTSRAHNIARKANITSRGISLKYDDADLYDFIDVVSNVLGINYIIDPAVSGRVTINMNKPVPKKALFSI